MYRMKQKFGPETVEHEVCINTSDTIAPFLGEIFSSELRLGVKVLGLGLLRIFCNHSTQSVVD